VPLDKRTAVILLNLGGPSSPEEIYPFLWSLFYDKAILSLPNPFRYLLATLISKRRLPEARHIYAQLGGRSPLLPNTVAQAEALEKVLGKEYRVFVAMRHASPQTEEVFQHVKAYAPSQIILLPLYPQFSSTTTQSSFDAWKKVSERGKVLTHCIPSYSTQEGFLGALKELTLPTIQEAHHHGLPRVLLTAHGLPEKIIRRGDPYQTQVEETAIKLKKMIGLKDEILCYQSRVGPLRWLEPSLESEIVKAAHERRPLVVVPISFVSEHSETLVELDITLKELALKEGCPFYGRVPTVGIHPLFIQGLAQLVRETLVSS
jgi:protoporphyrin/coproporphyrin ferrochelatase